MRGVCVLVAVLWALLVPALASALARAPAKEPMLTGPTLFVAFPNSQPSFEVKPSFSSPFYFDFTVKGFAEYSPQGAKIAACALPTNFTISTGSARQGNNSAVLASEIAFTGTLCNNASATFRYWVVYYAGNATEITTSFLNITLTLKPFLPVLVVQLNVAEWPFAGAKNALVLSAGVKVNVGPLEVGTGAVETYQIISVPYYNGLFMNAFIDSRALIDGARNFTAVARSFEIVDTDKPIQANVFIQIPHFNNNATYTSYATLTDEPEGITATSILLVVGIILGVFVLAGIAIALIVRFTGNSAAVPENEELPPERTPLVHSSVNSVNSV